MSNTAQDEVNLKPLSSHARELTPWHVITLRPSYLPQWILICLWALLLTCCYHLAIKLVGMTISQLWLLTFCLWLGGSVYLWTYQQKQVQPSQLWLCADGRVSVLLSGAQQAPESMSISSASKLTWFGIRLILIPQAKTETKSPSPKVHYFVARDALSDQDYRRLCAVVLNLSC